MQSNQELSGATKTDDTAEKGDSDSDDDSADLASLKKDGLSIDQSAEMESVNRLRREKRLAMNRESARARRKRKKMLITTLEEKVAVLTRSNEKFKTENEQLVLRTRGLTERLANQEEELVLLRALAAKIPDAQLIQHLTRTHQPTVMASPSSPPRSGMVPGTVPSLSSGTIPPRGGSEELPVRRLLSSHFADPSNIFAVGNHPGGPYGVPINRSINQDILGRIGRHPTGTYNQILPGSSNSVLSHGLNTDLIGQNTVSGPNMFTEPVFIYC
jgi:hypothetical protein